MTRRTLSKALLVLTIPLGVPTVARPALAGVHAAQGRGHRRPAPRTAPRAPGSTSPAKATTTTNGERHGELLISPLKPAVGRSL